MSCAYLLQREENPLPGLFGLAAQPCDLDGGGEQEEGGGHDDEDGLLEKEREVQPSAAGLSPGAPRVVDGDAIDVHGVWTLCGRRGWASSEPVEDVG